MKPTIHSKNNSLQAYNKPVPLPGSLDYYIYARSFPKIAEVLKPDGDLKKFYLDLNTLLDKTIIEAGQVKANVSPGQKTALLDGLKVEVFNYFSSYTVEDLKLCFHHGVRGKYGDFNSLCISVFHKWIEAFKLDEDRILAITAEENKLDKLKQELEDKKKREPKLKYLFMHAGFSSSLMDYYKTGNSGGTGWIYFDELRNLKMMSVSKDAWDTLYEAAKTQELKIASSNPGPHLAKHIASIQGGESAKVENTTKRLLFEKYIETAAEGNYCILSDYEYMNIAILYALEYDDPDKKSEIRGFMNKLILGFYEDYLAGRSVRGFHAQIYNNLNKRNLINYYVPMELKAQAKDLAYDAVYEQMSDINTGLNPNAFKIIFQNLKDLGADNYLVLYEAKLKVLELFFKRIKEENINLGSILNLSDGQKTIKSD